jgi:hypothetical protein
MPDEFIYLVNFRKINLLLCFFPSIIYEISLHCVHPKGRKQKGDSM